MWSPSLDRADLTLAVAGALLGAVLLGWLIGAIFARLNGRGPAATRALAAQLAETETRLADTEAALARERAAAEALRALARSQPTP